VVIETLDASAPQTFTAAVTGGLSTGTVRVWSSRLASNSAADQFVRGADVTPSGGRFSLTLQPGRVYTLTTTSGQGKGTATSPPAGPLPLPYADDFDSYAVGREARYLADIQGAFEVTTCGAGRAGRCVRQMSPRAPINWSTLAEPYALVGDLGWSNYRVSSDVLLEQVGHVELIGRATWTFRNPNGINAYHLRVSNTGAWSLFRNNAANVRTTLRSGTVPALGTNSWHNVALTFTGSTIGVQIDGTTVGSVVDATWPLGQVGLGTSQTETAQFDNLSVTPVAGPAPPDTGRLVAIGSGRCLDVSAASQVNGAKLVIWDCNGGANQQWTRLSNGALRVYGTKCLDVPGHSTTPGTAVVIWTCNGGANQQWRTSSDGTIVGVESGLCLDVSRAFTANGSRVATWTCTGADNQRWRR
jgi:hypothetical protein